MTGDLLMVLDERKLKLGESAVRLSYQPTGDHVSSFPPSAPASIASVV